MHEARARKIGDVVGEAQVLVKNHTKVMDRRICSECAGRCRIKVDGNRLVWDFCKLLTEGFRHRRFDVIQEEIWVTTWRRWSMESEKLLGENEMNNWVSSAYR